MNPLNYGSREACQRLYDAGVVLETDVSWYQTCPRDWELRLSVKDTERIPAPSMAEVWRELPEEDEFCFLQHSFDLTIAGYADGGGCECAFENTNPTDALIDLLIWVRKDRP